MFNKGSLRYAPDRAGREVLLQALLSFANEDFSVRLPLHLDCLDEEIAEAFNAAAETNERVIAKSRGLAESIRRAERDSRKVRLAETALAERLAHAGGASRHEPALHTGACDELRERLHTMLLLAKMLADNSSGNLSLTQIDYAQTLYSSGTYLLSRVAEIFDAPKMDASSAALSIDGENLAMLSTDLRLDFGRMAREKHLAFNVNLASGMPTAIYTDAARLRQILRHLLSNAFNFTKTGGVTLDIAFADAGWASAAGRTDGAARWLEFSVIDTGQGISADMLARLFDASRSTDGVENGDGGKGTGLPICRELTRMLGGELQVASNAGQGSRFSLFLPCSYDTLPAAKAATESAAIRFGDIAGPAPGLLPFSGETLAYRGTRSRRSDDALVLILDGNTQTASDTLALVRRNGYQGEIADSLTGLRGVLRTNKPDAIILGTRLADSDGWTVFDLLKCDPETRSLPLCMLSARACLQVEAPATAGDTPPAAAGAHPKTALARLAAACGHEIQRVLLVNPGAMAAADSGAAWRHQGVEVTIVGDPSQLPEVLHRGGIDAVAIGSATADMAPAAWMELLLTTDTAADIPVAMLGGAGAVLEIGMLKHRAAADDLLAETSMFLHRAMGSHRVDSRDALFSRRRDAQAMADRKVLIVDDDIRSIYAMTGALEQQGMVVLHAESAVEAIEILGQHPDTAVVLVDTLTTLLDSHDLIASIRAQHELANLPIIAVTAGADHGNRNQSREIGASDYLEKPVNPEQLLSLLRGWLVEIR